MKKQEIFEGFKKVAENIEGELMAIQANEITETGYAIIKTCRGTFSVYYYDSTLNHSRPFPIRTFNYYNEAQAVFAMLRYKAIPYTEYPF